MGVSLRAQNLDSTFFSKVDTFFERNVVDGLVSYARIDREELNSIIHDLAIIDLYVHDETTQKAILINAYNLFVIHSIVEEYPMNSVMSINGFFTSKTHQLAGEELTLNELETKKLIEQFEDPRLHFVLVCGALACPPIINTAYHPERLEEQIETQTRLAINDLDFIKLDTLEGTLSISQIFKWYVSDFGGSEKAIKNFVARYHTSPEIVDYSIKYYPYDWTINEDKSAAPAESSNNASRYVVSAVLAKGSHEIKLFNNLYSQAAGTADNGGFRSTFFTSTFSYIYGLTGKFNLGVEAKYRKVRYGQLPTSNFDVFTPEGDDLTRQKVSYIGAKIRWAPFEKLDHFSIQSTFLLPTARDHEGTPENFYSDWIDWNGYTWYTQFFNDMDVGTKFSLFTEIDFTFEDIGSIDKGASNRISTPATLIFSYFPSSKSTLYTLASYSPYYLEVYDYYYQVGAGGKYQLFDNFEIEVLYTLFDNKYLSANDGKANTLNIGIRKSIQ